MLPSFYLEEIEPPYKYIKGLLYQVVCLLQVPSFNKSSIKSVDTASDGVGATSTFARRELRQAGLGQRVKGLLRSRGGGVIKNKAHTSTRLMGEIRQQ